MHSRRAPEEPWASAAKLSACFSLSSVAQSLGINFNTLKERAIQQQDCRAAFIESHRSKLTQVQLSEKQKHINANFSRKFAERTRIKDLRRITFSRGPRMFLAD
ncbi:MAG: hypothetical protein CVV41_00245 [Candidatus Riflebacteria bacterium HGW-Riflebacteria-1]|nr:MAG: hypothetical protein CVV41_00245 [Candidatus Riflebacteria bacterium HGW-Riflebacteria-1]